MRVLLLRKLHRQNVVSQCGEWRVPLSQVFPRGTCVAVCCSVLQCVVVCCSVLQCVAVCCSVLQCVAVCCIVLQCVAVCCVVKGVCRCPKCFLEVRVLPWVLVCCSGLQWVAVGCSVIPVNVVKGVWFWFVCVPLSQVLPRGTRVAVSSSVLH